MDVETPNVDVEYLNKDFYSPDLDVETLDLDVQTLNLDVETLNMDFDSPDFDFQTPDLDVEALNFLNIETPKCGCRILEYGFRLAGFKFGMETQIQSFEIQIRGFQI